MQWMLLLRGSTAVIILVGIRGAMNENESFIIVIIRIATVIVLMLLLLSHSTTALHYFVPSRQGTKTKLVVGVAGKHGPCLRGRDYIHDDYDVLLFGVYATREIELVSVRRVDIIIPVVVGTILLIV